MDEPVTRRLYFDEDLVLTYNEKGWALLRRDVGLIGTDRYPEEIDVPYKDGKTLLQVVREAMEQGLGDPL